MAVAVMTTKMLARGAGFLTQEATVTQAVEAIKSLDLTDLDLALAQDQVQAVPENPDLDRVPALPALESRGLGQVAARPMRVTKVRRKSQALRQVRHRLGDIVVQRGKGTVTNRLILGGKRFKGQTVSDLDSREGMKRERFRKQCSFFSHPFYFEVCSLFPPDGWQL